MARVNKSQYAILGCLTINPMSAYEIKRYIQKSIAFFWTESEAQLYPTLKSLLLKKWVSAHEEAASKAGLKKVYTITEAGQKALQEWLGKKTDRLVYRNELLLKLFFGSNQSDKKNSALIEMTLHESEEMLNGLLEIKKLLAKKNISKKRMPYLDIVLDNGIESFNAEIAWCKSSLKKIK